MAADMIIKQAANAVHVQSRPKSLNKINVRLQVITAASMKTTYFWNMEYKRCVLPPSGQEAVRASETSFYFNVTTWCHIPEGYHLQNKR
jgi:hypothetical protein